jgi:hypothetical protein
MRIAIDVEVLKFRRFGLSIFAVGQIANAKDRSRTAARCDRPRTDELNRRAELLLPGALLVTIQAQLLAPFMLVYFCLAAFFD